MLIFKDFTFDAAHFLPGLPAAHKCATLHGHTYHLRIYAEGIPGAQSGWVIDFGEIKKSVHLILEQLDHTCLNNIPGLENPTCELIAIWIWQRLKPLLQPLARIELRETPTSGVVYDGT
ncbi:6-carboxytetrahydropterin synthase QueD [Agriterribacter sp.]|uniref:6-carboxytetrahydropterin synthase QueD n=1 Tax=Agriterribacter sp. TaxID=2821509 RepID=UPI002CF03736|nr:6-carboxytetrahydropterin synthase QueD [Agriterribacter sp.]HRO45605.1 6-carboxytetrahydropterin synthase QueD [Agriterribacter sp.]HRQ18670.1 6-carboxytetrahydropterin synthase QueD [Agriterribacter sp.]